MEEVILRLEDAGKRYKGAMALDTGDFELVKGEVHAIVGANAAGKSTLAGILGGAVKPDRGRLKLKGHNVYYEGHIDALRDGIAMVAQDISLVQQMTVAENVWIGRETEFGKGGFISPKARARATDTLLESYGLHIPAGQRVQELSLAQMRLVELMRALSYQPEILVLDEPCSGYSKADAQELRRILKQVHKNGISIVLVTHEPEEIYGFADRITVMREGRTLGCYAAGSLPAGELVHLMAGEDGDGPEYPSTLRTPGETALACAGVCSEYGARGASFQVRKGEIVGLYGLFGAGRMQTLRAIIGLDKRTGGQLKIGGTELAPGGLAGPLGHGAAMILPGKARLGFFRGLLIRWNTKQGYLAGGRPLFKGLSLDLERIDASKGGTPAKRIYDLSDNGHKRVIMGRSMGKNPQLLISCEPSQGIQASLRKEIYKHLDKIAGDSVGVLLSTGNLDELLGMSDRILVLRDGLVAAELTRTEATREKVLQAAFGF